MRVFVILFSVYLVISFGCETKNQDGGADASSESYVGPCIMLASGGQAGGLDSLEIDSWLLKVVHHTFADSAFVYLPMGDKHWSSDDGAASVMLGTLHPKQGRLFGLTIELTNRSQEDRGFRLGDVIVKTVSGVGLKLASVGVSEHSVDTIATFGDDEREAAMSTVHLVKAGDAVHVSYIYICDDASQSLQLCWNGPK